MEEAKEWIKRGQKKLAEKNAQQRSSVVINIGNQIDFSPDGSIAIQDMILTNKKGEPYAPGKISEWFGNGKGAKPLLKAQFEKYIGDDGRSYLRRKPEADAGDD